MAGERRGGRLPRVVLAWSGGGGSAAVAAMLAARADVEFVTVTVDLADAAGSLADVRDRALAASAVRAHVIDARDGFAREFLLPAVQVGASDDGPSIAVEALGTSCIAKHLAAVATLEGSTIVAHGAASGSAAWRIFQRSLADLDPALTVLDRPATSVVDTDEPASPVVRRDATRAANDPAMLVRIEIEFDKGCPLSINRVEMPIVELVRSLATIAPSNGTVVGGGTARDLEALTILAAAHRALATEVAGRSLMEDAAGTFAACIQDGRWFGPGRRAMGRELAAFERRVNGRVAMTLEGRFRRIESVEAVARRPRKALRVARTSPATIASNVSSPVADPVMPGRSRG